MIYKSNGTAVEETLRLCPHDLVDGFRADCGDPNWTPLPRDYAAEAFDLVACGRADERLVAVVELLALRCPTVAARIRRQV